jgi:hypothetical protein
MAMFMLHTCRDAGVPARPHFKGGGCAVVEADKVEVVVVLSDEDGTVKRVVPFSTLTGIEELAE